MAEQELKLALESLRGQLMRLDTVLKMSIAEQRRVNDQMTRAMQRQEAGWTALDARLDKQERRLAGYTGALASLWLLIQVVQILLR